MNEKPDVVELLRCAETLLDPFDPVRVDIARFLSDHRASEAQPRDPVRCLEPDCDNEIAGWCSEHRPEAQQGEHDPGCV